MNLSMRYLIFRSSAALLAVAAVSVSVITARAEVFPVSADLRAPGSRREIVHTLETLKTGTRLGEQRSEIITDDGRLRFEVVTNFEDGTVTEERGVMDIDNGYRARSLYRVSRKNGVVDAEERVDFLTGHTEWTVDGVRHEQTFSFPPDTYAGPMLALVLAAVPARAEGHASFQMITFRPDPRLYTIRVDVVDRGRFDLVSTPVPATKLRLKVDLGSVGNTLFKRLIPTHYFWYSKAPSPDFLGFEGQLGHDGPELLMIPEGQHRATPHDGTVVAQQ